MDGMNLELVARLQAEREAIDPNEGAGHREENEAKRAELLRRIDDALDEPRK